MTVSQPFLVARAGRTQPNTTCEPTKSPGVRQSATIMVSIVWKNGREGRTAHGLGREVTLKR